MKKNKLLSTLVLIVICTCAFSTNAFAKSSYVATYKVNPYNTAQPWSGWEETSSAAFRCFNQAGYNAYYFRGNDFTKQSFRDNIGAVDAVYINSHANTNVFEPMSGGAIFANEIYSLTRGAYKFVFLDGCKSGSSTLAHAFNMDESYSTNCAYLGWTESITTESKYVNFTVTMFNKLQNAQNVNNSVWYAYTTSGIPQVYAIYGNSSTTLYI